MLKKIDMKTAIAGAIERTGGRGNRSRSANVLSTAEGSVSRMGVGDASKTKQ